MLKHCSPSSVDIRRRSRRNLTSTFEIDNETSSGISTTVLVPIDFEEEISTNVECCSEKSFSTVSSINDQNIYENLIISPVSKKRYVAPTSPERQSCSPTTSGGTTTILIRHEPDPPVVSPAQSPSAKEQRIPIKVYASCLRSDIEYKTLSVTSKTTSKELIWMLLSKYKMRHRDPKLFYLTMDISIRRTGIPLRRTLALDEDSRPAELKSCHPWGECKFTLQMRKGGIVKIHDSILMAESKYKCLLISEQTTADEVINILFHCYGLEDVELPESFCIYEVSSESERKLHADEQPVQVQSQWSNTSHYRFVLKQAPVTMKHSNKNVRIKKHSHARKSVITMSSENEDRGAQKSSNSVVRSKKWSKTGSVASLCSEVEEVVTPVDHDDGGHFNAPDLDMSYSSGESEASSEFSALRFRDSSFSSSTRSSASTDSGLLLKSSSPDSLPPFLRRHHNKLKKHLAAISSGNATIHLYRPRQHQQHEQTLNRHYSLHSLLEALPAASVDTGAIDCRGKMSSLSSLSTNSRTSDFDGFFYI